MSVKKSIFLLLAIFFITTAPQAQHKIIETEDAPVALGPYSQAVLAGNTLYLSGQIALNPETGKMTADDIVLQTRQVFKNIKAVLTKARFTLDDVVKSEVYLSDINNYGIFNKEYSTYFPNHKPARVVVEVARLPKDALVEISMIAVKQPD